MTKKFIPWKSLLFTLVVALMGTLVTTYVYRTAVLKEINIAKLKFYRETQSFVFAVQSRFVKGVSILKGTSHFFSASNEVTLDEWNKYCNLLNLKEEMPSLQLLTFVKNIDPRTAEKEIQSLGEIKIWPEQKGECLAPIVYVWPSEFTNWPGYNVCQSPLVWAAAKRSAEKNEAIAAPAFNIDKIQSRKSLFTLFFPIHDTGRIQKGEIAPYGWVMGLFDLSVSLETVVKMIKFDQINLRVYSGPKIDADQLVIARVPVPDPSPLFIDIQRFHLGGVEWTVELTSGPNFKHAIDYTYPIILLVISSISTLILMGFVYYLSKDEESLRKTSFLMEQNLEEMKSFRQAIVDSANYAIICTDKLGKIVLFNKAAEKMLGYKASELIGKSTPEVFHDQEEMKMRAKELSELLGKAILPNFEVFTALAQRGIPDEKKWTYIHKNKTHFPVFLSITAIKNGGNAPIGYMGIAKEEK